MNDDDRLLLGMIKLSFAVLGFLIIVLVIEASGILDSEEERYEQRIRMEARRKLREAERIESQTRWNNMIQQLKMEKPFKSDNIQKLSDFNTASELLQHDD